MKKARERIEHCSNCGTAAKVIHGDYKFKESGLKNVILSNVGLIKCTNCGNIDPILPKMNELFRALAFAIAAKPGRLRGDEVRFLREYLEMNSANFAAMLGVDKTTLSKWENSADPVGQQSDKLIRMITLSLGDGLRDKLEGVVRSFAQPRKQPGRDLRIRVDSQSREFEYA